MEPDPRPADQPRDQRRRRGLERLFAVDRLRPITGLVSGTALAVVATAASIPVRDAENRTVPGLLLLIPVIVAAVLGGQVAAVVVAVEAAFLFAIFLPPFGSPRVEAGADLLALLVFVAVAATAGRLVVRVVAAERLRSEALEELETQRRALLRAVSHDLRTPLTVIRAVVSDLQTAPDHQQRAELLELVGDEAERLDRLVANLLRMSRIEAGALRLEREPVDIGHLVESCLNRLARLTRHVAIVAQVEGPLPLVAVDAVQLEQVVTNLVENAVKHSPVGGSVFVRVLPDIDGQVRVSVADEGPGLGSRSTHELFEPFAVVSDSGSSGVGLAICKAIVEGHGGAIAGGNRAGGGACFTFVLPAIEARRPGDRR
jgi:K+-sensing histidine kinase KdpD